MQWLSNQFGYEHFFVNLWTWLRWPVALVLMGLSAALVYYAAPAAQPRFRFITPGAVLSVLIRSASSFAFDYYVRNFANYSKMYGSVGSIVLLLLYFYISASVLLFGAEVNAAIERHAPSGMPGEARKRHSSPVPEAGRSGPPGTGVGPGGISPRLPSPAASAGCRIPASSRSANHSVY